MSSFVCSSTTPSLNRLISSFVHLLFNRKHQYQCFVLTIPFCFFFLFLVYGMPLSLSLTSCILFVTTWAELNWAARSNITIQLDNLSFFFYWRNIIKANIYDSLYLKKKKKNSSHKPQQRQIFATKNYPIGQQQKQH